MSIVETRLRRQRLLFWAAWILGPGVLFVSRFYESDWFGRIWAPDARPYTIDAFEILVPAGCALSVLISAVLCAMFGGPRRQPESWLLMVAWLSLGTLVLLSWRSDLQGFDGLPAALGFLSSCVAPVVALARRGPQQSVVSVPALAESRVQLGLCGTSDFYKWIDTADSSTLCIRFVDSAGEERWRSIVFRGLTQRREPHLPERRLAGIEAYEALVSFPPSSGTTARWRCIALDDSYYVECLCEAVDILDAPCAPAS